MSVASAPFGLTYDKEIPFPVLEWMANQGDASIVEDFAISETRVFAVRTIAL